ncbi:MAG: hypothetical protein DLM52_09345 [Chthoniobacterales bacterium]|nr:MAG: hypothetical protein DLM52_09345 [Chthoniobacterales bacterium]
MTKSAVALLAFLLAGCAIHQFAQPSREWTTRNGQLLYHGKKRVIIGEVLVRFSNHGDFELTFTKGPGVSMLTMHTDPQFARVQGLLVGLPWSGPIAQPPARARGWLALREEILRNPRGQTFRARAGDESFIVRF